ncbi:hypothetical protein Athai_36630 [Actinocatenispora thailandica]|uniref:Uncharacterized protein n=1 Tax=Actinocatenispora thailandica TaxID=227318 RepID=A0A7R7DQR6_9ACTN|nr:hypothetical protein Athai_36630 [Actinocatenispora thailandica]
MWEVCLAVPLGGHSARNLTTCRDREVAERNRMITDTRIVLAHVVCHRPSHCTATAWARTRSARGMPERAGYRSGGYRV